jgi:hypothetical protein
MGGGDVEVPPRTDPVIPPNECDTCTLAETQTCANGKQTACVPDAAGCLHMSEVECAGGICIEGGRCAYVINRQWGGTRGNSASGVAFDSHGDVYVASGTHAGLATDFEVVGTIDAALIKWSPRGVLHWARPWGTPGWDNGDDVAIDGEGRIYTIGTADGELYGVAPVRSTDEWPDIGIIRMDGAATIDWSAVWGSEELEYPRRIAIDADGDVYVAGTTQGEFDQQPALGGQDVFLTKWSASGQKLWTRMMASSEQETIDDLALDAEGNVYLSGATDGMLGSGPPGGEFDAVLAKWSPDGALQWLRQWGDARSESALGVAIVGERVYVVGAVSDDPDSSLGLGIDAFIHELDTDGNPGATRQWGRPRVRDTAVAIVADADGTLYVCGESPDPNDPTDTLTTQNSLYRLDADGAELWSVHWGTSGYDGCRDIALGPDGLIATVGRAQGPYPGTFSIDSFGDGPAISLIRVQ